MYSYHAIIYSWTCVVPGKDFGKKYIGQTRNEKQRYSAFFNLSRQYAGVKLEDSRQKYGPEDFKREVLREIEEEDLTKLQDQISRWEVYYIKQYDTIEKGFNTQPGGGKYYRNVSTEIIKSPKQELPKKEDPDSKVTIYKINIINFVKFFGWSHWRSWDAEKKVFEKITLSDIPLESRDEIKDSIENRTDIPGNYRYFSEKDYNELLELSKIRCCLNRDSTNTYDTRTKSIIKINYSWKSGYGKYISGWKKFDSIKEAAEQSGYTYSTIRRYCNFGLEGYMLAYDFIKKYLKVQYDITIN